MKIWKITLIVIFILGFLSSIFYFTVINNIFVVKPEMDAPDIDMEFIENNYGVEVIEEEHIEYLANELGGYMLHSSGGEDAVIVFEMIDTGSSFALIVNGDSYVTQNIPNTIDLIVSGEQIVIARLIRSQNLINDLSTEL